MKTNLTLALFLLLSAAVFGQASKQVLSVGTIADLRARLPQTPSEIVEVRNGSSSNLWDAPRTFIYDSNSVDTADNVFVTTNKSTGRYIATDRSARIFNAKLFGAIPNDGQDDTAALQAAAAALQSAGGGTLRVSGGTYLVRAPTGGIVMKLTNLTDVKIEADAATFVTDDFGDGTFTAAALTVVGTTATATTPTAHGWIVGDTILVKNSTVTGYDGPYTVATVPATNQVTFALSGYSTPTLPASALIRKQDFYRELFRFQTCTNVHLGKITFAGTVHPRDIQYRLGWVVMNARTQCQGITGELAVNGAAYGLWAGDYDSGTTGDSTRLVLDVNADHVGYPVSTWGSGHDSEFRIWASDVHRGIYAGAMKRSKVKVWVKNYDVTGAMLTHQPVNGTTLSGCEDMDVLVKDTGTTEQIKLLAVGTTRFLITFGAYDVAATAAHRNIRVRLEAKDAPETSAFQILTYRATHSVEGITVSGLIDQRGLALADVRHDFYVDQTAAASGVFRDIALRDFIVLSAPDLGAYRATFKATNMVNDLIVDNYRSSMPSNFVLPPGRSVAKIPALPGWTYESFEQAQLATKVNGARLNATTLRSTLSSPLGSGDFTLAWAGTIPYDGNPGLFAIGTATNGVSPSGLGLALTNASLQLRFFGATSNDWRALTVTNWQTGYQLKNAAVTIIRDINGVRLYGDGRRLLAGESTSGTPPAWSDALTGTNWIVGTESIGTTYAGTVLRLGAWNYDRTEDLPALASGFATGQSALGSASAVIDSSTLNGGFETAGGGGADVFANWTESATGSSAIASSASAHSGSAALSMSVDSSNSLVGISQAGVATIGQTYRLSVWVKNAAGTGGAISIVGASDGESIQQLSSSTGWQQFTLTKVWGDTTLAIKRADGASRTFLIDDVEFKAVGSFSDVDFTLSPQDRATGRYAEIRGGATTRIPVRSFGVSEDRGDASVTVRPGHDAPVQLFQTALTGARVVTLATDHAIKGDAFRIVRTGAGAGSLTAGGYTIAADEAWDFVFDGSAWGPMGRMKVTSAYSGGGGTNASTVFVDSLQVDAPNFVSGPAIALGVIGTNVTPTIKTNSIGTNQLSNSALAALLNRASHTGSQDWSTITGTPTTRAGYGITDAQAAATILSAVAALSGNGVIAKTGSGTVATRTITGDSEAVVANGSGVSGDPTISIGAGIARLASPALTGTPTVNSTNLMAYIAAKQDGATILSAIAALSGNGLVAKTASGTVAARTLTGDSEIVVVNGDGVSANPTLSIGSAIARLASPALTGTPTVNGTNLMAYVAGKQDAATILSGIAALSGNGMIAKTGSGTVAARTVTGDTEIVVVNGDGVSGNPTLSIGAAIARLASPAFTGSPTAPTAADGTSNTVIATTAWVLRNAGSGGGGGSGNANTNNSQGWAAATTNTFNGAVVFNGAVTVADLIINSATYSGVWGFANGALGVTNAADARTVLGLVIGTDVQAYDADLLRIASVAWASGDFVYRDGTGLTNFASTTTGRDLLSAANAAAGRTTLGTPNIAGDTFTGAVKVPMDAYNASTWTNSSKTNEVVTKGDIAAKLEALTVGGFITSVDATDLQVTGSQLSISNVIGTGRIVKESALTAGGITNTVQIDIYTNTSGTATWTKPAGAKLVEIYAIGGGGGGGSGRRGTNQHAGGGGGGGGGGAFFWTFSAADLGSTETVTVGTNGVGASGIAVDNTDGSFGTFGGASTVGTVAYATAGTGGGAGIGTGTGASSGQVAAQLRGSGGLAGAHGSNASIPTDVQDRIGGAAAGGGGGSITAAVVTNTPSRGGSVWSFVIIPGGAAGTSAGVNGTNGTAFGFTTIPRPGSGGGGGYPGFSSIGNGGNGGWPGGGGGGGAGCRNGTTSGSGGNGASGVVVIKTYF